MLYWTLHLVIGIPIGLFIHNAGEWVTHKYLLHGLGKKKKFWTSHWHDHHSHARKNDFYDSDYQGTRLTDLNQYGWEALSLVIVGLVISPLAFWIPGVVGAIWYSLGYYWYVHKRGHLDPEWAKKNLPWHYDHHMGKNQDANWCVSRPWFDHLMGTREVYYGTEQYELDQQRKMGKVTEALANDPQQQAALAIMELSHLEPGESSSIPFTPDMWNALSGGLFVNVQEDGSLDVQSLGRNEQGKKK